MIAGLVRGPKGLMPAAQVLMKEREEMPIIRVIKAQALRERTAPILVEMKAPRERDIAVAAVHLQHEEDRDPPK